MFWLLASFVLIFQLPTISSSLVCVTCNRTLKLSSSDTINTTNCSPNPNTSSLCTTLLKIDYVSADANVTFDKDPYNFADVLNGKKALKYNMIIGLSDNTTQREIQVFCSKNNSCSDDITKIYEKSKYSK